eukprot:1137654-Pelagomonas_calceolata.AAC.2
MKHHSGEVTPPSCAHASITCFVSAALNLAEMPFKVRLNLLLLPPCLGTDGIGVLMAEAAGGMDEGRDEDKVPWEVGAVEGRSCEDDEGANAGGSCCSCDDECVAVHWCRKAPPEEPLLLPCS